MSSFDDRLEEWFQHKHWRVMTELTGQSADQGIPITYDHGAFEVAPPGVFVTPLGHRGRKGFIVQEADADGQVTQDSRRDSRAAFGESTLRRAAALYGTVTGLPEPS